MARRRRTHLHAPEAIDDVLGRAGEDRFTPFRPPIPTRAWRDAVGARIADRSVPVTLERGVLTVRAATSVWANELQLLQDTIKLRLREQRIAVDELRFRVGPVDPAPRPPERRTSRAVPSPAPLTPDLAAALRKVDDKELRESIALAARASLAWQKEHTDADAAVLSEEQRAARAPLSSGRGSDPPGRTSEASPASSRYTRGAAPDRRR
jgi:predicted nucleic acid-binding Zn ribbon protein